MRKYWARFSAWCVVLVLAPVFLLFALAYAKPIAIVYMLKLSEEAIGGSMKALILLLTVALALVLASFLATLVSAWTIDIQ
jgi:hypothetical protein